MDVRRDKGFVLISALIILTVLCGFLGLMTDTAHVQYVRQRAQTAADAAAVAAYLEMQKGNTGGMRPAALADAIRNGAISPEVAVFCPPSSGNFTKDTTAVEAVVTELSPTFFMRILGSEAVTVTARAVAVRDPKGGVTLGE